MYCFHHEKFYRHIFLSLEIIRILFTPKEKKKKNNLKCHQIKLTHYRELEF